MKIDRLFEITYILIDKKSATAKELADKFGVSVRTIYRDIDILSSCGIPVYTEKGRNGGIFIMEQYSLNKTLLTDGEQSQLVSALQSIDAIGQGNVSTVLSKLKGIFKKNFEDWIEIDFSSWSSSDRDKEMFELIKNSIFESTVVSFTYFNAKGEKSQRTAEPYKLIFKSQSWYMFAFCKAKEAFRFFKLSRIDNLRAENSSFVKQKTENTSKEYKEDEGEAFTIKLKIDSKMAFRIHDELSGNILETQDDHYIVEAFISNSKWILPYLLSFGNSVEILEPLQIRNEYVDVINNISKKYNV